MRVVRLEGGRTRAGGPELAGPGASLWVDCAPTPENLAFLAERFRFHPLALEDCAHEDQRVKLDQYPDALFVVLHRLAPSADESEVVTFELHAFLTAEALVTVHSAPIPEVDRLFERCASEPDVLARGPDFAFYRVADAVTDLHFVLVDALTDEVDEILDEAMSSETGTDLVERIALARRKHAVLRRKLSPQREVYAALARPGQPFVRDQTAVYFRDTVDHSVRLTEEVDMGRDLIASAMEAYLSRSGHKLSAVTSQLTVVATIFLPLNFLVGFFGMNLVILPPEVAIPVVLVAIASVPFGMWLLFRRMRWL
ncbi:MAG TPA: magnesium transporter CorA family protein [Anaeromyxobacteraceae bacterium]|nr:magnesium transporter CorA family protein [Anaeromyxobacteraceae bacterium]